MSQKGQMSSENAGAAVVCICSDGIGRGDDELGKNLMMNFLHQLSKSEAPPNVLIMMNAGVKLAVEGSEVLSELNDLENMGTRLLVCGTCLNFFNIKDQLKAGKVSNMGEIAATLLDASKVITA